MIIQEEWSINVYNLFDNHILLDLKNNFCRESQVFK